MSPPRSSERRKVLAKCVLVLAIVGLFASCSPLAESDCETASPAYQELFDNGSITEGAVESDIYLKVSAIRETWYLVAEVEGSIGVWVTDRDPQGDKVGHIISGNRAAQRVSNFDFVDGPMSMSTLVQAAGDPDRVEAAESCIPG